jgi:hypothetical protein
LLRFRCSQRNTYKAAEAWSNPSACRVQANGGDEKERSRVAGEVGTNLGSGEGEGGAAAPGGEGEGRGGDGDGQH